MSWQSLAGVPAPLNLQVIAPPSGANLNQIALSFLSRLPPATIAPPVCKSWLRKAIAMTIDGDYVPVASSRPDRVTFVFSTSRGCILTNGSYVSLQDASTVQNQGAPCRS
jgi:hypothetical protein